MKKAVILVPVHCAPKVAMMTLGTWMEAHDGSYEAEVIIGVHDNYHHYHNGLGALQGLPGVKVVVVKEIDWAAQKMGWEAVYRYSTMHATSLKEMMKLANTMTFDYLAVLDHDLVFKKDFIGWAMGIGKDLVGSYMEDRRIRVPVKTEGGTFIFAPKFSVWHMVMTHKFFQKIMEDVDLIFPIFEGDCFFDTFSRIIRNNEEQWKLPIEELTLAQTEEMVKHLWTMSFNYGMKLYGAGAYWKRLAELEADFDKRFPNGIHHLFEKIRSKA